MGAVDCSLLTLQCYAGADEPSQCIAQKEDYMECLHKTKEVSLRTPPCHAEDVTNSTD